MSRRGFTLIEVLVSLAIFALAAISLGAAYSNVLLSRIALKQDEQRLDDIARCRAALLETPGFDDVATGGEIHLPGGRLARWQGEIEATAVSDLFAVRLVAVIEDANGTEEEVTEARMLLRPTWSIPSDRQKIRNESRQRLGEERGYKEADGNSRFISSPTRGKTLVPNNPTGQGAAGGKGKGAPGGKGAAGDKGAAGGKDSPAKGRPPTAPSPPPAAQ